MRNSQFIRAVNRACCQINLFLKRHRAAVILAAFVFWSALLVAYGYFDEFDETSPRETRFWGLLFGFFWLTIPMSFAIYLLSRLVLNALVVSSGYKPDEKAWKPSRSDSG